MALVTVYQFTKYDIASDHNVKSRRWATREAIERARGAAIESTGIEIDEALIDREVEGMTKIGFDPNARKGFQTQVA